MRILLTGASGNFGSETLLRLLEAGHEVRAFDLDTKATRAVLDRQRDRAELMWGDLQQPSDVERAVSGVDVIMHNAALTPPLSELKPELALRVNVAGTRHLVESARRLETPPRILFASSATVFGVTQPRVRPPRRANDPLSGSDHYSLHKIEGERLVRTSGLDYCIMRIGVSLPLNPQASDLALIKLMFAHSLASRVEYVHPRDVALAQVRALTTEQAWNKVLLIGGGARCQITNGRIIRGLLEALGMGALPERAFPDVALSGDWLDTSESQALLRYQEHTFEDFVREIGQNLGVRRFGVGLMAPFVRRWLVHHAAPAHVAR